MNFVILQYASGAIQVKHLSNRPRRLYGVKLNNQRPVIAFLPISNKCNTVLLHSIYLAMHPERFKGIRFI